MKITVYKKGDQKYVAERMINGKLSVLFGAMIDQIKEQDVINQTNR